MSYIENVPNPTDMKSMLVEGVYWSAGKDDLVFFIQVIIDVFKSRCTTTNTLRNCKARLSRLITDQINGTIDNFEYETRLNKLTNDIVQTLDSSNVDDFRMIFNFDMGRNVLGDRMTYYFRNDHGKLYEYKGEVLNGKPDGNGRALYLDGEKYVGGFKKGNKQGEGRLYDRDGKLILMGLWVNDEFQSKGRIKYFEDVSVSAGMLNGKLLSQSNNYQLIDIPGIKSNNNVFAFPVIGNSMAPQYHEGDIVVCKKEVEINNIDSKSVYVVFHEENMYLKYVKIIDGFVIGEIKTLELISYNHLSYSPFQIEVNSNTNIFKVLASIRFENV